MSKGQEAVERLLAAGYTLETIGIRVISSRGQLSNIRRGLSPCPPELERRLVRAARALPQGASLARVSAV